MNHEKRIAYIDLAKGFCICLVVFYHIKGFLGCNYLLDSFFSFFRLPLYFFLSGLFFKDYGSFRNFSIKKLNRLLVPFLFFYLCFSVIFPNVLHEVFGKAYNNLVLGWPSLWAIIYPGFFANFPIWFLWCLFFMNILFWVLQHVIVQTVPKYGDIALLAVCFLIGLGGHLLMEHYAIDYGRVVTVLVYIPFFGVGYLFKQRDGLWLFQSMSTRKSICYALLLAVITLLLTSIWSFKSVFLFYICGISGTLFILLLSRSIGRLPFFSYVGRYSIIVLLTHGIIMWACSAVFIKLSEWTGNNHVCTLLITVAVLFSYYLVIPFMRRFFPHVTAQQPLLPETNNSQEE